MLLNEIWYAYLLGIWIGNGLLMLEILDSLKLFLELYRV
jgi:hypothetical protein